MIIELSNISKVYQMGGNRVEALKDLSFACNEGEFCAIMGPSGSGKSTLMHIIGCLTTLSSGVYFLEGRDVGKLSKDDLAYTRNRKIGFVFQTFNLLPRFSVLSNVELPLLYRGIQGKERREQAGQMLERVGLAFRKRHLPSQLSGGEQQRVSIARALVLNPKLILADEPTGNLDSVTGKEIMEIFCKLKEEGKTIILVTHNQENAQFADKILTLRDGRIE
jgi:putative ABC transport system ATP-binding protein